MNSILNSMLPTSCNLSPPSPTFNSSTITTVTGVADSGATSHYIRPKDKSAIILITDTFCIGWIPELTISTNQAKRKC